MKLFLFILVLLGFFSLVEMPFDMYYDIVCRKLHNGKRTRPCKNSKCRNYLYCDFSNCKKKTSSDELDIK